MDTGSGAGQINAKLDEESMRKAKRASLRDLNARPAGQESSRNLDSSLKRHTALTKRMRQSVGTENHDQILKDIESLSLEKYIDEMSGAVVEGVGRCKTEKDVWSAVEIISALHRRFPTIFTPALNSGLSAVLAPPSQATLSGLTPEQREKEDSSRISRQRPALRVCAELALVGIIKDGPDRSGGEWMMKVIRQLLSNDPSLSSLPLLSTFLKAYSRPYLGIVPPASTSKQLSTATEPGNLSNEATKEANGVNGAFPALSKEEDELVEKDIRDRFKKMCEGYFESVSKKLVIEHDRLQDQDRRNHEAYIRSGEIFEDRQQAYEKMTKGYEKLLASCQTLSELLYLPLPKLKAASHKVDSIQIGGNTGGNLGGDIDLDEAARGGKWEDEEERRFFEDISDLKDYVPKGILGLEEDNESDSEETKEEKEKKEKERVEEEVRKLEEELAGMEVSGEGGQPTAPKTNGNSTAPDAEADAEDDGTATPTPGSPKTDPSDTPQLALQGPSQLLTALLTRLPDATNRAFIDQAAFMGQTPKNRTDVLPHYSRLVATLNKYMPDIGTEVVALLDDEFRYLQRKKNVVKELADTRRKCNPPERTARQEKERSPVEMFIRHLIYDVLTKKTIDKVLKLLRKLDWNDEAVYRTLHKVFTKPWKVKYGNIALLAMLTYDLQRYHPAFTISVVDQVLEDIRRGLEQNIYSINQRRVATIKYLGELYIYRLVGSSIVFDTLWTLVTFGHPEGRPLPGQACTIDMPDDFFRVRLLYVLCKDPLPMDVDFMLSDSMEALRPKLVMFKTFEEAAVAVDEMFSVAFQNAGLATGDDSGEEEDEEEGERRDTNEEEDGEAAPLDSPIDERAPSPEAVLLKSSQEILGPSEDDDADFAKELAKMVTDNAETRKVDKKTALALWESTVPPPIMRKKKGDESEEGGEAAGGSSTDDSGIMKFTLFTKRGNKPQMRQLAIPAESALAIQTRTAQLQDKVEQQHLKKLVLDYEQREEAEELRALEARNRAGAIKIRYVG
ncbi:hypothetical protein EW026_g3557 [Hermanssonia centrifuga]|uniref:MIF4G domain-containing protein n=1 Tax=Hermanssonia centrifuga TaxID=98765 RepID=A0A4S4KKT3_9APHY|nr:hypothetical protein EW026_g3557 [Hermanssonia centrifuga]